MSFTRTIEFWPAFDKRNPDPHKNYGIHGVVIRFYLRGPAGVIQFVLDTNWHLPHVTEELKGRICAPIGGDHHWMERPLPADIGYHSPKPMYEGQPLIHENCPILGGPCYYDGSGLQAEDVFKVLLAGGSDALWSELERRYYDTFDEERGVA